MTTLYNNHNIVAEQEEGSKQVYKTSSRVDDSSDKEANDGASSIDTITALVQEGQLRPLTHPLHPSTLFSLKLTKESPTKTTAMKSNCAP